MNVLEFSVIILSCLFHANGQFTVSKLIHFRFRNRLYTEVAKGGGLG